MFVPKSLSSREVLQTASILGISAAVAGETVAADGPPAGMAMLKGVRFGDRQN